MLKLLLDNGADPNVFTTSKSGTALQMACSFPSNAIMVELLINAGADIDGFSGYRFSSRDGESSVDSDTESSADSNTESCSSEDLDDWSGEGGLPDSFQPPILIAASRENWETVQLLLDEGADMNTGLKRCPSKALEEELDAVGIAVFTPLQAAIRAENITMTRMLLSYGA